MSREMVLVELWYECSIQCHYSCDMVIVDCLWDFTSMSREMVLVELWYECSIQCHYSCDMVIVDCL